MFPLHPRLRVGLPFRCCAMNYFPKRSEEKVARRVSEEAGELTCHLAALWNAGTRFVLAYASGFLIVASQQGCIPTARVAGQRDQIS